ncbi:hypothetical protein PHLGIDRAFT_35835, partial [Phlebiopsis gigantea 11061_1 CR5-6]
MNKRELGLCSLVCRLWARRCRPYMLQSLSLHSLADFHYLLHLVDSAQAIVLVPPLAECISYIGIVFTGSWTVPWFHRIRQELMGRNIDLDPDNISLELERACLPHAEGSPAYAPRSLSTSLPRTLPRSVFAHSVCLLTELHFRAPDDLLRLIDEQPALSTVIWRRLTFDKPEDGEVRVPRPRVRRRRPWAGLEAFTISQWSDVDAETRLVFVILAEKLNTGLSAASDWWTAMARATASLLLPVTRRMEFGANDNIFRAAFETAGDEPYFTHDVEYHVEPSTGPLAHVSLIRICFHYPEKATDLARASWAAFEELVLSMDPVPHVELHAVRRERADIFEWLLDTVCESKLLPQLYSRGMLEVEFPANDEHFGSAEYQYLALEEVLAFPSEDSVDGRTMFKHRHANISNALVIPLCLHATTENIINIEDLFSDTLFTRSLRHLRKGRIGGVSWTGLTLSVTQPARIVALTRPPAANARRTERFKTSVLISESRESTSKHTSTHTHKRTPLLVHHYSYTPTPPPRSFVVPVLASVELLGREPHDALLLLLLRPARRRRVLRRRAEHARVVLLVVLVLG